MCKPAPSLTLIRKKKPNKTIGQERPLVSKSAFIHLKDLEPHWNVYLFLGIISLNVHSTEVLWDQEFKRNSPLFSKNPVLWREADMLNNQPTSVITAGIVGIWGILGKQKRDPPWWNQGMCHKGTEPNC